MKLNGIYRVLRDHDYDGEWDYHEWILLREHSRHDVVYLDSIGRRNNGDGHAWLRARCNKIECTAQAVIREKAIAELLPAPWPTR